MSNNQLTLGSLFSGSGGFELAGLLAGIKPIWNSDIDPFAVRVTTKRLPEVKHYGDVSTLNGAELEPVDVITFGSPCFPEGTLVLTEQGYIPIEEVEVGMKVLTHMGRWRRVTAAGSKFGETVILRGNHYGLECTPNHPIYNSGEKKYYPQLGNGKRGNIILLTDEKNWIPAGSMTGKLWAVPNSVQELPISAPVYSGSWRQKVMPPLSNDLFYFIGRWLGDGWVCSSQRHDRPNGQTYGSIYLCDSADKEEELRSIVEKMSARYTVSHDRGVVRFHFISQVLCEWLTDNFGSGAMGKRMPGWVFGLPVDYRQSLIQGLLDSDGCSVKGKDNAWKISTVSKALAESIRLLAETLSYSTTVHKTNVSKTKTIENRVVNQHDYYTVVITLNGRRVHLTDELHGWYRVREVIPTHQTKVVYNLTVDEDNSYVADGIVVHNCQDLSIAGRRAGIHEGERSNLFFQAVRIIREMRDATNGEKPRFILWENVPGAFTSNKGEDFKAVLEAIVGIVEENAPEVPPPEKGRWPKADVLVGEGWSIAYRVFDSQYWGVPQRRKRIFLVGDLAGGRAGDILSVSEGLSGYSPEGFRAWQRAANGAEAGVGATGRGIPVVNPQGSSGVTITEDVTGTLIAQDHGHHPAVLDDGPMTAGFLTENSAASSGIGYEEEKSPTVRASKTPAVLFDAHGRDARYSGPHEVSPTLSRYMGTGSGNVPLKIEPAYSIGKEGYSSGEKANFNFSVDEELAPTIQASGAGAVAAPEADAAPENDGPQSTQAFGIGSYHSKGMLSDNPHAGYYEADTSRTLDQSGGSPVPNQGGLAVVETYAVTPWLHSGINEEVSPTLLSRDFKDPSIINQKDEGSSSYRVRRLTPVECARLQGFPDWWCSDLGTDEPTEEEISFWMEVFETWGKITNPGSKPKQRSQLIRWLKDPYTDSAVYRLFGNAISIPVAYFILAGVVWAANTEEKATVHN